LKQKIVVARLHKKIANQRSNWLHHLSRNLADTYGLIAIEDLNIRGMVQNHHLAKSINDASWNIFHHMLEYKVSETGTQLVRVDAKNTSQTCSQCGFVKNGKAKLKLSERMFICEACGLSINRDLNAARNILSRAGLARSHACGDDIIPSLEKVIIADTGTICSAKG
jgi:putative transposase